MIADRAIGIHCHVSFGRQGLPCHHYITPPLATAQSGGQSYWQITPAGHPKCDPGDCRTCWTSAGQTQGDYYRTWSYCQLEVIGFPPDRGSFIVGEGYGAPIWTASGGCLSGFQRKEVNREMTVCCLLLLSLSRSDQWEGKLDEISLRVYPGVYMYVKLSASNGV